MDRRHYRCTLQATALLLVLVPVSCATDRAAVELAPDFDPGNVGLVVIAPVVADGDVTDELAELIRSTASEELRLKNYKTELLADTGWPADEAWLDLREVISRDLLRGGVSHDRIKRRFDTGDQRWVLFVVVKKTRDFVSVPPHQTSGGLLLPDPVIADILLVGCLLFNAPLGRYMWKDRELFIPTEDGRPVLRTSVMEEDVKATVGRLFQSLPSA